MRTDAIALEDGRLEGLNLNNYPWMHERHRIFPESFEKGRYKKILDIAAGIGVVGKRIQDNYPCLMLCNDISEESLKSLKANNLNTTSFDLDDPEKPFPLDDESFDAIISLATVEHIINLDHHMKELRRILRKDGHLYISAPNYNGIHFVIPFLLNGKTFHDPMNGGIDKYEFYAHVRYFTYRTLIEFVTSFGFVADKVFLPIPKKSSRYLELEKRSKLLALSFKTIMYLFYKIMDPRWAFHPVICFSKTESTSRKTNTKPEKIVL